MWLRESNRQYHFLYAIPFGFFLTLFCVIGLATGMEFKDCHHSNPGSVDIFHWNWSSWDWGDWIATLLGGVVGSLLRWIIILIIIL